MYRELFPSIDHLVPAACGGADDESSWISTSMLRNSAKAHWPLDELGWTLAGRRLQDLGRTCGMVHRIPPQASQTIGDDE